METNEITKTKLISTIFINIKSPGANGLSQLVAYMYNKDTVVNVILFRRTDRFIIIITRN